MNPFDITPVSQWTTSFITQNEKWIENQLLADVLMWYNKSDTVQAKLVQCLLEHKCDSNAQFQRDNALLLACTYKLPQCVQVLLQHGADPNHGNDNGWTPLMESCYGDDTISVKLLLEHKANVHVANEVGNTAAHIIAFSQSENNVIKSLFETYGANPTTSRHDGYTVFHCCIARDNQWLFTWLLDRYPKCVNIKGDGQGSLLRMCVYRNRVHFLKHLLTWAHCDVWSDLHLLPNDEEIQPIVSYAGQRISMQMWAAIELQKSPRLCQYLVQHPLCDVHLCEEWVTWFAN